ncbi:hypothetical protein Ahy_B04g069673 [Arachis hypogaea]|uniref:Protein FAR1-RELATED SEQUENCE n=1 Tax=Arachis hypogaea TaxID=3818 RepID=A0A444ZDA1_ARAHY|nr:hypothetical protein Ahy_B04g069673 [Arachis hypogaea]
MLKQHRELSMFVHRTIKTNKEARLRPSKTYQSFVAASNSHRKLSFIENNVRNYITRKVRNISEQDDAKEFGKEQREKDFDVADFHTVILCATKSAIEAQFQHVYTHEKFIKVQGQFRGKSKNIKTRHTHIKSSQDEPLLELRSKRFDDLVFWSHNICKFASEFEELTRILHRAFDNVMAEMQEYQARSKGKSLLYHKKATLSDVNDLQSPPRVRTRGRPKNRLESNLEKNVSNATKKKKKLAPSELNFLDSGSTIQSRSSLYNAQNMNYPGEDYRSFCFY